MSLQSKSRHTCTCTLHSHCIAICKAMINQLYIALWGDKFEDKLYCNWNDKHKSHTVHVQVHVHVVYTCTCTCTLCTCTNVAGFFLQSLIVHVQCIRLFTILHVPYARNGRLRENLWIYYTVHPTYCSCTLH